MEFPLNLNNHVPTSWPGSAICFVLPEVGCTLENMRHGYTRSRAAQWMPPPPPPLDITIASHIQNEETKQWDRYGIVVDISKYGHHNQYLQRPGLQQALNYKTGDDNKLLLLLTIL